MSGASALIGWFGLFGREQGLGEEGLRISAFSFCPSSLSPRPYLPYVRSANRASGATNGANALGTDRPA